MAQTIVGAVCGFVFAIVVLEHEHSFARIMHSLESNFVSQCAWNENDTVDIVVPLWLRIVVVAFGAVVLYKLEIKKLLTRSD